MQLRTGWANMVLEGLQASKPCCELSICSGLARGVPRGLKGCEGLPKKWGGCCKGGPKRIQGVPRAVRNYVEACIGGPKGCQGWPKKILGVAEGAKRVPKISQCLP